MLKENSHLLQPPINSYCVYDEHMTVMIVGGPNARNDYHINETPEWFYQCKANIPHNPVRFTNTVGIVIEQKRVAGSLDRLRWYCSSCKGVVHEAVSHCTNLRTQIKEAVNKFKESEELRKCEECGTMVTAAPTSVKA